MTFTAALWYTNGFNAGRGEGKRNFIPHIPAQMLLTGFPFIFGVPIRFRVVPQWACIALPVHHIDAAPQWPFYFPPPVGLNPAASAVLVVQSIQTLPVFNVRLILLHARLYPACLPAPLTLYRAVTICQGAEAPRGLQIFGSPYWYCIPLLQLFLLHFPGLLLNGTSLWNLVTSSFYNYNPAFPLKIRWHGKPICTQS